MGRADQVQAADQLHGVWAVARRTSKSRSSSTRRQLWRVEAWTRARISGARGAQE